MDELKERGLRSTSGDIEVYAVFGWPYGYAPSRESTAIKLETLRRWLELSIKPRLNEGLEKLDLGLSKC
jgi:hypothetical protein